MNRPGEEPDHVSEGDVRGPEVLRAFRDGARIDRALRRAVQEALRVHRKLGNTIVVGEDGKAVRIPADQIPIDD